MCGFEVKKTVELSSTKPPFNFMNQGLRNLSYPQMKVYVLVLNLCHLHRRFLLDAITQKLFDLELPYFIYEYTVFIVINAPSLLIAPPPSSLPLQSSFLLR